MANNYDDSGGSGASGLPSTGGPSGTTGKEIFNYQGQFETGRAVSCSIKFIMTPPITTTVPPMIHAIGVRADLSSMP